jgi:hypothetical protein
MVVFGIESEWEAVSILVEEAEKRPHLGPFQGFVLTSVLPAPSFCWFPTNLAVT